MIVKAIIRDWDGNALIGERHDELKSTYYKDFGFNFEGVDGFLDNKGQFYNREDALQIAIDNGQFDNPDNQGQLFSEDLW